MGNNEEKKEMWNKTKVKEQEVGRREVRV